MSKLKIGQARCKYCGLVTSTGGIGKHMKNCTQKPAAIPLPEQPPTVKEGATKEMSDQEILEWAAKLHFVVWKRNNCKTHIRTIINISDNGTCYEMLFFDVTQPNNIDITKIKDNG